MKITKELLNHLGIVSISIKIGNADKICFWEKQLARTWIISTPDSRLFAEGNIIAVQINFSNSICSIFEALIIAIEKEFITIELPESFSDSKVSDIIFEINSLEQNDKKYGRRKESRIKIKKEFCVDFCIRSIEQKLILENQIIPCAIIDVSIHGICIVTLYSPFYAKEFNNFKISVSFTDCTSHIILDAHKVHAHITETESKKFVTLSCQILEPIHFEWKRHVINLLEKLEKKSDFM